MKSCFVKIAFLFLGLIVLLVIAAWVLYQSAQQAPEFYQLALDVDEQEQKQAGSEFETRMLQLKNDLEATGRWEAIFTDKQINGWLAADLPRKFPQALPKNVYDPRVAIEPKTVNLAFRYESKRFSGIVVATGEVYCTDQPNQIAIRIDNVRAGLATLPVSRWLNEISRGIQRSGFSMVWTEEDGNPVALVTLPEDTIEGGDVIVESIELLDGKVRLRGKTNSPVDDPAWMNRTGG